MKYRIEKISFDNYAQYINVVNQSRWGNLLMPDVWSDDIWGGIVVEDEKVIGGWVGVYRGNKRFVKWLAKSVYFDSYPFFSTTELYDKYQNLLVETMRDWAERDDIVMFNLTHWVRGFGMPYLEQELNATFLLPLQESTEAQWKLVESKQRNIVRKGDKNGVVMRALCGKDAIVELPTLQLLREQTQQHAILKNANASMLLKSDEFFTNLLLHTDSTLFIGSVEGKPATVAVMIVSGETAYYYSGGSNYELNKQTGSSAYVIWNAIEYYRNRGDVKYLDMGGVPVKPDQGHPAYGVYAFKRSFGGEYMEFDAGIIVISTFKYKLLNFLLKQRKLLRLFSKSL